MKIYLSRYASCLRHEKHKIEHELGCRLLVSGLCEIYHLPLDVSGLDSVLDRGRYGKPFLKNYPEIHFNISHCDGLVGCVFAETAVGLDIEKVKSFNPLILKKVLTADEYFFLDQFKDKKRYAEFFYRFWTLKESVIKQNGKGMNMRLTDFSLAVKGSENPEICCSIPGLHFYQQHLDREYIFSLCSTTPINKVTLCWKNI